MTQQFARQRWTGRTLLAGAIAVASGPGCIDAGGDTESGKHVSASASLPDSNFEIDDDANLVLDGWGTMDWATVEEYRQLDKATGQTDDSYAGGSKEDMPCPLIGDGSIPNNKSDLLAFGVYAEAGSPGFLHLYWSRVHDPSGTTLMDFELNQSSDACSEGKTINNVRTEGDLLLEYRIDQGGARASITIREWDGTAWGPASGDLAAIGAATGTINSSPIALADSDELGAMSARTFGEASIDLDFIFDEESCKSYGSAFVKSRSSDSFTSALKDFIAPMPVSITNCGQVTIRKETDPGGVEDTFDFTHTLATDPASDPGFELGDGGSKVFSNVLLGSDYTVTESAPPAGWELTGVDCDASTGVDVAVDGATITFDIDDVGDKVDCTYTNQARGTLIVEKKTSDGSGTFSFTSDSLSGFSLTTSAAGDAGKDSKSFGDLVPGTYDVAETVPAGWNLSSATCSDGSSTTAIEVGAGETVTCTFVNARERGAIAISKTRKHAADGAGSHPHPGVTFLVSGGDLAVPVPVVTDSAGQACLDGLVLSGFVGDYTVTEVLPTGYVPDADLEKTVSVTGEATCSTGTPAAVAFGNTPLTSITVAVDSIVSGGTSSTISCTGADAVTTGANGDGSLTLNDLPPGSYTCTIVVDP